MKKNIFVFFVALFCVSLVVSNIIAGKLYAAPFGLVLPSAVWLFPMVYILSDIIPEVYGLFMTRKVIWMGFILNAFAVLFFTLTLSLPHPEFWQHQEAYTTVLGFTPRLLIASLIAYLVGTHANAWVLVKVKLLTNGKFLWMRTISSTIVGETLDSTLFIVVAFWGIVPFVALPSMILAQTSFKILYEIIATPLTYLAVNFVKKVEHENCPA
jgi:uncharacterized integral membrane protein (TIGR00697 family)